MIIVRLTVKVLSANDANVIAITPAPPGPLGIINQ
jgi:hypothetical protein